MTFEDWMGDEHRDKEDLKTETDIGNKKSEILMLKKRVIKTPHRHLIIKKRFEDLTGGWILGHPSSSCNSLGAGGSHLGIGTTGAWGDYDYFIVVNPNRTHVDNLHSDRFKDTSSTANWDTTTGEVIF